MKNQISPKEDNYLQVAYTLGKLLEREMEMLQAFQHNYLQLVYKVIYFIIIFYIVIYPSHLRALFSSYAGRLIIHKHYYSNTGTQIIH